MLQYVQFIGGGADHLIAGIAGHFKEAGIDLDVAQITEATNYRRCGVGREGFLETLLGVGPVSDVVHDQHQGLRLALAVRQDQAADTVNPRTFFCVCRGVHFHHDVTEGLAASNAVDRIAVDGHPVIVAIAQDEALGVGLGIGAEIADARDAMHGQSRFIGPADGLVGVEQDHAVGQARDDLLQLATVGFGGQDVLAHCVSTSVVTL
ncbi:hypothetical protein D3C81_1111390 [compost metagenome]